MRRRRGGPQARPPLVIAIRRAIDTGRSERLIGRIAIAGIGVAAILELHQTVLPSEHIDVLWIAMIGATIVTAFLAGFWASVITAVVAGLLIDVSSLDPRGSILISSAQDALTLALFIAVSLMGAAAVSRPWRRSPGPSIRQTEPASPAGDPFEPLTERERQILAMLGDGMSNSEIARRLVVSTNTVKSHLEHLYGKLNVRSRGRAVAEGRRLGLLAESED